MRKLFLTLGAIVLVAIAGALYFINYRLDGVVETQIEKAATMALGTAVEVGGVQTNLRDGTLKIAEISVANPPGFDNQFAVRLHDVDAAVDYSAREIKHVVIENPEFIIEERDGSTNFEQILQALEAGNETSPGTTTGGGAGGNGEQGSGARRNEPVISIKHFRIDETRAVFESRSLDRYTDVEVDAIEMDNLRGTPTELADQIAREVIGELSSEAATEVLKAQAKKQLKGVEGKAGDILRGLLGGGKDGKDDNGSNDDGGEDAEKDGGTGN
jgi:hypothetical protein